MDSRVRVVRNAQAHNRIIAAVKTLAQHHDLVDTADAITTRPMIAKEIEDKRLYETEAIAEFLEALVDKECLPRHAAKQKEAAGGKAQEHAA